MADRSRELELSLRLKAGRWLAGSWGVRANSKSMKGEAKALPLEELAQRSPLLENGITANKLGEIESMRTPFVPPSQVALISQALGVDLEGLPMLEPAKGARLIPGPPDGPIPQTTEQAESPSPEAADEPQTPEEEAS